MFKKVVVVLFAICWCNFLKADTIPAPRLLYYVDSEKSEQLLVPYIETTLRDMRDSTSSKLLRSVTSLNILMESKSMGRMLTNFYKFLNEDAQLNVKQLGEQDKEFVKALTQSELFLKISIKEFNGLLEYDFILYDVVQQEVGKTYLAPTLVYKIGSSTFIDPRSINYKSDLIFAIKQLFPESNQKPELDLFTDKIEINGMIYVYPGDTIDFGLRVADADSPQERFIYTWNLGQRDSTPSRSIIFCSRTDQSTLKIVVNDTGNYFIDVRVFDGVDTSKVSTYQVRCIRNVAIKEFYTISGGPIKLYHYTYILFDYNHYHTEDRLVLSVDSDTLINAKNGFRLYPLTGTKEKLSTGYAESGATKQDSLFFDVVINRDSVLARTGTSVKSQYSFYLHRQKHKGNYALQAEVEQNNKKTSSEIIPIQFHRVWPVEIGFDLTANFISPRSPFKRANFISYGSMFVNAHFVRTINIGIGADISLLHGKDSALSDYRFLRNTNYYVSCNWRPDIHWNQFNYWGAGLNAGLYQFPSLGKRNPGIEIFGLFCVESDKKYQFFFKPGYKLIRDDENIWYHGISLGFRFIYQPSRHDPLEGY